MVKTRTLIVFIFAFVFLKPHFYYYSYYLGRLSDMITIFILLMMFIVSSDFKYDRRMNKYVLITFFYFMSISIALFNASFTYELSFKDFVDYIRPFALILSLLLGYSLQKKYEYSTKEFLSFIIFIGLISGIVAMAESKFAPIFYKIYSDINHFSGNRPTGIFYDFAEYGAIQMLAYLAAYIKYQQSKLYRFIFLMIFFAFTVLISTSKAAIILLALVTVLLLLRVLKSTKITPLRFLFIIISVFILVYLGIDYIMTNEKLHNEMVLMFEFSENLPSVGNRIQEVRIALEALSQNYLSAVVGFSALRNYNHLSYIEIAFFAVLFRYGIFGIMIYYSYYYILLKEKIASNYRYIRYLIIAMLAVDMVAAMTNRFSLFIMLNILFGLMISESISQRRYS